MTKKEDTLSIYVNTEKLEIVYPSHYLDTGLYTFHILDIPPQHRQDVEEIFRQLRNYLLPGISAVVSHKVRRDTVALGFMLYAYQLWDNNYPLASGYLKWQLWSDELKAVSEYWRLISDHIALEPEERASCISNGMYTDSHISTYIPEDMEVHFSRVWTTADYVESYGTLARYYLPVPLLGLSPVDVVACDLTKLPLCAYGTE